MRMHKRPRTEKPKKEKKAKKNRKDKKRKDTVHTDPSPGELLTQKLIKEVDDIHMELNLSPTCEEESMLPAAVTKREEDLEKACMCGKCFLFVF